MKKNSKVMAVHIKQLLLMVVLAIIYSKAATQPGSKPKCQRKCGSVDIPFPFGTTKSCSIDNTFLINCKKTSSTTSNSTTRIPFLPNTKQRVLSISLHGTLRVAWPVSSNCYDEKGNPGKETPQEINMMHFPVSPTKNKLIVVGCDTVGSLIGYDSGEKFSSSGCVAFCSSLDDIMDNETCSGPGCCKITLPLNRVLTDVLFTTKSLSGNHSLVHEFNPCDYVFLVEHGKYNFKSRDLHKLEKKEFPVLLDWTIGNQTCQQAQKNLSSYACKADKSTCHNSIGRPGYFCNCSGGFRGNPYLTHGCQDIDECKQPNDCVEGATCNNHPPGSYSCKCPAGYKGDGKNNGTKCSYKSRKELMLITALCVSVSLPVGSFYAYLALKKRKLIKLKQHFFQQNGGLLLQQQIEKHRGSSETAKVFTLEELNEATNNFHEGKILGQGGQGTVYKGVLHDERIVAIKKSKINDPNQIEPFINKVVILSKINHRNVVKLLGCCLEAEVPLLVYEFIPNGTLYEHLHDQNQSIKLTWKTRLRIGKETAGVLAYLHSAASTPVIHRDVKSANILLDRNLTAKVSDFGASKVVPLDHTQITTLVQGTLGYLDPEYFHTSQLTDKSDVYSFGVVLAELVTGKKALSFARPEEDRNLAVYFASSIKKGRLLDILDRNIDEANIEKLMEVADIAERCLKVKGEERPTMKEVAMKLEGIFVIEEQRGASENFLSEGPSIFNVEDSVGGIGISYSINEMSMSLIGGR